MKQADQADQAEPVGIFRVWRQVDVITKKVVLTTADPRMAIEKAEAASQANSFTFVEWLDGAILDPAKPCEVKAQGIGFVCNYASGLLMSHDIRRQVTIVLRGSR